MGGNDDRENSMHTVSILSAHIAIGGKDCKKNNMYTIISVHIDVVHSPTVLACAFFCD